MSNASRQVEMIRDLSLIGNIQVAMIGIVLVVGLFYIWRSICRLEEKMERVNLAVQTMSKKMASAPTTSTMALGGNISASNFETDAIADAFMKQVFGQDMGTEDMVFTATAPPPQEVKGVHVEEVEVETEEKQDDESEADSSNPLSRSKLKKMNLETLKGLCKERGLSEEGSKAVLTDRLLGLTRE